MLWSEIEKNLYDFCLLELQTIVVDYEQWSNLSDNIESQSVLQYVIIAGALSDIRALLSVVLASIVCLSTI